MMRWAGILVLAAAPAAAAPEATHEASNGQGYVLSCNADGFVLAPSDAAAGVLYLGRSCDAAEGNGLPGVWCYANGGVLVTLPDREVGFPRQEVSCPERPKLGRGCVCQ